MAGNAGFYDQCSITGIYEVARLLSQLPATVNNKAVVRALKAGAAPIVADARRRAPKGETGALRQSIKAQLARKKYEDRRLIVVKPAQGKTLLRRTKTGNLRRVSPRRAQKLVAAGKKVIGVNPANYAHLVEFPHRIVAHGKDTGRMTAGQPFMRPAYDSQRGAAAAIVERELLAELNAAVAELGGMSGG